MKWLKRIGAVFVALITAFLVFRSTRHEKRQDKLVQKAREIETNKAESMNEALKARQRAGIAKAKAQVLRNEARIKLTELEETDEDLASRVRAYGERRRQRLRDRS